MSDLQAELAEVVERCGGKCCHGRWNNYLNSIPENLAWLEGWLHDKGLILRASKYDNRTAQAEWLRLGLTSDESFGIGSAEEVDNPLETARVQCAIQAARRCLAEMEKR